MTTANEAPAKSRSVLTIERGEDGKLSASWTFAPGATVDEIGYAIARAISRASFLLHSTPLRLTEAIRNQARGAISDDVKALFRSAATDEERYAFAERIITMMQMDAPDLFESPQPALQ
jgi:hypothetical protein